MISSFYTSLSSCQGQITLNKRHRLFIDNGLVFTCIQHIPMVHQWPLDFKFVLSFILIMDKYIYYRGWAVWDSSKNNIFSLLWCIKQQICILPDGYVLKFYCGSQWSLSLWTSVSLAGCTLGSCSTVCPPAGLHVLPGRWWIALLTTSGSVLYTEWSVGVWFGGAWSEASGSSCMMRVEVCAGVLQVWFSLLLLSAKAADSALSASLGNCSTEVWRHPDADTVFVFAFWQEK